MIRQAMVQEHIVGLLLDAGCHPASPQRGRAVMVHRPAFLFSVAPLFGSWQQLSMSDGAEESNLPAQIANAVAGVPAKLIPSSVKALDRLIGAAVDIPVAWLNQQKAKIDAQTQAYAAVETAIAKAVATEAGATPEIVQQAINVLVRKEYRKQVNRESVGQAAIEDLRTNTEVTDQAEIPPLVDDDWLNVFERYAEDASTERMQKLWGRVLAGEIRKPGRYSMRTLRFLSEFSQADALTFADFCNSAFSDFAPRSIAQPDNIRDVSNLIYLEAAGLITGTDSIGLQKRFSVRPDGVAFIREGNLAVIFNAEPNTKIELPVLLLTPLGQELISLLPGRDPRLAAERVANAMRSAAIKSAYLATVDQKGSAIPMKIFWQDTEQVSPPAP